MEYFYRQIVDPVEKQFFLESFNNYIGASVPLPYLDQGRVMGLFDQNNNMMGGYALIFGPTFRSLLFLPDQVKNESQFLQQMVPEALLEVNCAWLSPDLKSHKEAIKFWMQLRSEVLAANRTYLVVMYNKKVRYLASFYARLNPRKIYEGPTQVRAGEKTHEEVFVGYVTMFDMRMSLYRNLYSFARRLVSKRIRGYTRKPAVIAETAPAITQAVTQAVSQRQ